LYIFVLQKKAKSNVAGADPAASRRGHVSAATKSFSYFLADIIEIFYLIIFRNLLLSILMHRTMGYQILYAL